MRSDLPYIHQFRTRGGYYFYDVNRSTIVNVNKEKYKLLTKLKRGETVEDPWVNEIKQKGFLSSNRIYEVVHPITDTIQDYLDNKMRKITLQVTQQCNFRCEYCVYSDQSLNRHHSVKKMSFEVAKKGIDFLIEHSKDNQWVNIGFYGGEPLLEFDFVKKCIEYAESISEGKHITYALTTNGSLLTEEMVEYFQLYNLSLLISLDGPREIHDRNRKFAANNCGTFDSIIQNIQMIKEKYPEYYKKVQISTVIDPETDFSCSEKFFSTEDVFKDKLIISTLVNDSYSKKKYRTDEEFTIKWEYEKFKLFLSLCKRLEGISFSKFLIRYRQDLIRDINNLKKPSGLLMEKGHHAGPCIPGQLRLFINAQGEFYPCERVVETCDSFNIGNVFDGFDIGKVKTLLNIGQMTQDSCKGCFAVRECNICAAQIVEINDYANKLSKERKLKVCLNVRTNVEEKFINICTLKEFGYEGQDILTVEQV